MPIDPLVALAMSVQNNKGIYALLLGSGVSRSAGIPTGWGIVLDLVNRLAHACNEEPIPNPEQWIRVKYGEEPDYSRLLDELTRTTSERRQLLHSYFEPTEVERERGLKQPTAAHRAIADLMLQGFFRVVLTTNFDKLLERALIQVGIEPIVISNPDAIRGAMPLAHARHTIIKLHGDYLDTRLRNTPAELEKYERPMNQMLDRVLDEFGLIVCGWSGDYDTALQAAIERSPVRRFPMYWASLGLTGNVSERLIRSRRGTRIVINDADTFFVALRDSVLALDAFQNIDPVTQQVAVARVKKYLPCPERQIDLHDFLNSETLRTIDNLRSVSPIRQTDISTGTLSDKLTAYENTVAVLSAMVSTVAYWSKPEQYGLVQKCLELLIASAQLQQNSFDSRLYPALLVLYSIGVAAIAADKYDLVSRVFDSRIRLALNDPPARLVASFHQYKVIDVGVQQAFMEKVETPLSNRLFAHLREITRGAIPSDLVYEHAFDRFEYLLGVFHCYHNQNWVEYEAPTENSQTRGLNGWGPLGCFAWRNRWNSQSLLRQMKIIDHVLPDVLPQVNKAFFPGNSPGMWDRFLAAKDAYERHVQICSGNWR